MNLKEITVQYITIQKQTKARILPNPSTRTAGEKNVKISQETWHPLVTYHVGNGRKWVTYGQKQVCIAGDGDGSDGDPKQREILNC